MRVITVSRSANLTIGKLSELTGVNIETIRYYERIGLPPKPRRAGGRYRRYDDEDVARLRFIRRARQLGFTLNDIRAFMKLARADGREVCNKAQDLTRTHIADIRAKIADLRAMESGSFKCSMRM